MNPFIKQNKEIREFKLPAKMILFNGQVPQKGDIVQIDLGNVTKKARVEDLYFRPLFGKEIIAFVHLACGNSTYAVSVNMDTGMMLSYWYDNSTLEYHNKYFDLYNEDTSRDIILSTKDVKISLFGAFFAVNYYNSGVVLQVRYYDNNGHEILEVVSTLKAKNWTISKFDTYVYLPSIKGN